MASQPYRRFCFVPRGSRKAGAALREHGWRKEGREEGAREGGREGGRGGGRKEGRKLRTKRFWKTVRSTCSRALLCLFSAISNSVGMAVHEVFEGGESTETGGGNGWGMVRLAGGSRREP